MCLAIFLAIYANKSVYLAFDLIWAAMCLAQLANVLVYWGGCSVVTWLSMWVCTHCESLFSCPPDLLSSVCLGSSWATVRGEETKPWIRFAEVAKFKRRFLASSSPNSRHHFHTRCLAVFGRHGDLGTTNKQKHLRQTKYDGARKDKINWYLYISEKVILTGGWEEQRERE